MMKAAIITNISKATALLGTWRSEERFAYSLGRLHKYH